MVFYTRALKSAMPRKMALAMLLAANALGAWADNRLHIEDFRVLNGETGAVLYDASGD